MGRYRQAVRYRREKKKPMWYNTYRQGRRFASRRKGRPRRGILDGVPSNFGSMAEARFWGFKRGLKVGRDLAGYGPAGQIYKHPFESAQAVLGVMGGPAGIAATRGANVALGALNDFIPGASTLVRALL